MNAATSEEFASILVACNEFASDEGVEIVLVQVDRHPIVSKCFFVSDNEQFEYIVFLGEKTLVGYADDDGLCWDHQHVKVTSVGNKSEAFYVDVNKSIRNLMRGETKFPRSSTVYRVHMDENHDGDMILSNEDGSIVERWTTDDVKDRMLRHCKSA
jgi:hypothetical protein